jgi:hypothetical protein
MNSLAARKQALVAESEIYRRALANEIQNLKLSATRIKRNLNFLRLLKPILLLAPVAASIIGLRSSATPERRPSTGWRKWWGAALVGWRLYRQAVPMLGHFISRRNSRSSSRPHYRRARFPV